MYTEVVGKDGTAATFEPWAAGLEDSVDEQATIAAEQPTFANRYILTVAADNANAQAQMAKISQYLGAVHDLTVRRVHLGAGPNDPNRDIHPLLSPAECCPVFASWTTHV